MGKKTRKTRWRTLPIADEISDSEDSSTNPPTPGAPRWHYQKQPPGRFLSQPRRRYDAGAEKSTRSSSTASENKITFNEDEYTKITTPRQDVLFKKGYLNKPRNYQTQTSTGTSTTSTGNGTPDHQSTDLEYESQFIFPNGFVDQNGIYYVNSYDPYPLMLYNPSTYYQEYSGIDKKRYSTGSLTESTSPNNEEVGSQEHSEAPVNVSEFNHHQFYNMVYPAYYVNGVCPPSDMPDDNSTGEPKRPSKRRRRKASASQTTQDDTSEYTDDKSSEEDGGTPRSHPPSSLSPASCAEDAPEPAKREETKTEAANAEDPAPPTATETASGDSAKPKCDLEPKPDLKPKCDLEPKPDLRPKYDLKPDAQEFVPRAFRNRDLPPIPVKLVPPNFVPIPLLPVGDQAFIPPAIPVNFFPGPAGFVGFVPPPPEAAKPEGDRKRPEEAATVTANREEVPPKGIDIASVVSKLEEAAKEQEESKKMEEHAAAPRYVDGKPPRGQRFRNNFRRNGFMAKTPPNSGEHTPVLNGLKPTTNGYHEASTDQNGGQDNEENVHVGYQKSTAPASPLHQNRSSPQRFRKNWKPNGYQSGSPRRYPNSPNHTLNGHHESKPQTNYSDLLKKGEARAQHHPNYVKQNSCPPKFDAPASPTKELKIEPVKSTSPIKPNQWIPVASKKKRKGKNVEECEDVLECDESDQVEEFESYDVNQLVDVVPPSKLEEVDAKPTEIEADSNQNGVEEILTTIIATNSAPASETNINFKIPEVSEIEKTLILQMEEVKTEDTKANEVVEEIKIEGLPETSETKTKAKLKKKTKKGTQKTATKRVIITDVDLSMNFPNAEAVEDMKPVGTIEEKKPETVEKVAEEETKPTKDEDSKEEAKKPKKKKKKPAGKQQAATPNGVAVATTATVADETYDFLLDDNLLGETDKTNDELSEELDKLIQKGMYSSLEGKIRSLNIDGADGFLESVLFGGTRPESRPSGFGGTGALRRPPLKPTPPPRSLDLF